jgi:leader peptidase (prepilin peptidase) / N-methyltransferase
MTLSPPLLPRWCVPGPRNAMSRRRSSSARSMRAALINLLAAAGAVAAAMTSVILLPGSRGLWGASLAALMAAIAAVDARRFIIPDPLTAASLALGLAYAAVADAGMLQDTGQDTWLQGTWLQETWLQESWLQAVAWALLRGAVMAAVFLGLRTAYRWWRGRDGIGLGDVKLAAVAGVWLDWPAIPIAIDIAAVAALGAYLAMFIFFRRAVRRTTLLPFGLFLAPAIWLTWIAETTLLFYSTTPF